MISTQTRKFLVVMASVTALLLPATGQAIDCTVGTIDVAGSCVVPTPEQAIDALRAGNASFTSGNMTRLKTYITPAVRSELATNGQHPYAIVLTCSDSRLPPEILFNKGLGEIFTVRVAGNIVDKHELASIEYAIEHLHAKLVVVLGHERCGAVSTAYDVHGTDHTELGPNLNSLITSIDPAVTTVLSETLGIKPVDVAEQKVQIEQCIVENIKNVAEALERDSTIIKEKVETGVVKIVQAKYDLDSGVVDVFAAVTLNAGPGGSFAQPSPSFVSRDLPASFTVNPAGGYVINTVAGCGGTLSGNTFTTAAITGDCTIAATFTQVAYPLNVIISDSGTVGGTTNASPASLSFAASGTGYVTIGGTATLTATPTAGWFFNGWTGACSGLGSCQVVMDGEKTVNSFFSETVAKVNGGSFSGIGGAIGNLSENAELSLRAMDFFTDLSINQPLAFTIKGGYDPIFSAATGVTTIRGSVIIVAGTVTMDNIVIR